MELLEFGFKIGVFLIGLSVIDDYLHLGLKRKLRRRFKHKQEEQTELEPKIIHTNCPNCYSQVSYIETSYKTRFISDNHLIQTDDGKQCLVCWSSWVLREQIAKLT